MAVQSANPPQLVQLDKFTGMNQQASRSAIDDQELAWCENLTPVGPGNLRSVGGPGTSLFTASGKTIVSAFSYVRAGVGYCMAFLSDGSAIEQPLSGGSPTTAFAASTFTIPAGTSPRLASWGTSGIVIVNNQTNGYWAWDGTAYAAGAASPSWLNGGTATNMPTGIKGTAVTIFQSRAVVLNGNEWLMSAPSNGAQFATASGGVLSVSSDPFLAESYMDANQTSGFLYLFGDSSISVVSNVQTGGSPATTTFNYANVDPQVGHASIFPVQPFGRALVHVNSVGVYALYGGAAEKVSDKLNVLFATNTSILSLSVASLNGVKLLLCLISGTDYAGSNRPLICAWDGRVWHVLSQGLSLQQIFIFEVNSDPVCYGITTTDIFPLFSASGSGIAKVLQSKFYPGPNPAVIKQTHRFYADIQDIAGTGASLSCTVQTDRGSQAISLAASNNVVWTNSGSPPITTWTNTGSPSTTTWTSAAEALVGATVQLAGLLLGWLATSTSAQFSVQRMLLSYEERTIYGA